MQCRVTIPIRASVTLDVEADSIEEAVNIAAGEADWQLCHHCTRRVDVGGGLDEEAAVVACDGKLYVCRNDTWVEED